VFGPTIVVLYDRLKLDCCCQAWDFARGRRNKKGAEGRGGWLPLQAARILYDGKENYPGVEAGWAGKAEKPPCGVWTKMYMYGGEAVLAYEEA